jgi:hypothetical protein
VDDFGAGPTGQDGTQAPPPPRVFPDPLAGLVTGERHYQREATAPRVVVPPLAPPQPPSAPYFPPPRRPARAPARRTASTSRQAPVQRGTAQQVPGQRVTGQQVAEQRATAQRATEQPAAHVPHAELARRQPGMRPVEHAVVREEPKKKSRGGLIGCLVALAALSGLLFNVVREIIEAVVDLLR